MARNVWQWCENRFSDKYYQELPTPAIDPVGPTTGDVITFFYGELGHDAQKKWRESGFFLAYPDYDWGNRCWILRRAMSLPRRRVTRAKTTRRRTNPSGVKASDAVDAASFRSTFPARRGSTVSIPPAIFPTSIR